MYDPGMPSSPVRSSGKPLLPTGPVPTPSARLLYQDDSTTPLGSLPLAGIDVWSRGVSSRPMRVLGFYALVLLLEGGGAYRDALGSRARVHAGEALLLFPEVPHAYGPVAGVGPGARWDEAYFLFSGPTFDALREAGALSPERPVLRPEAEWRERMLAFGRNHRAPTRALDVLRFAALLAEVAEPVTPVSEGSWLSRAEAVLRRDLERALDLGEAAAALDLSPDAFRKRFAREGGVTPARYRAAQRIAAAEALLRTTRMPLRAIAEALGFTDEFHLSRRFKEAHGVPPSEFRRRSGI